ncbi:CDP-glycerol glycerophosphotransferase family protein [Proteus mirabilis]|uniref:CDP-glycerol glycerophosphotransferase family protein n=1 Tax=Proteus mirabilis TaxID=584 RepID=UPI00073C3A11|nr:CDP-glycerol glycerophosphotransferase family protein [Proteus mirabilis]NAC32650.1 hypothetical protein [Escherichia coli]ELZ9636551.1 CDP-glycerol glycerophosphotransferase family protein [Proteus mirabilis]KSX98894.1 hypothetical protein APT96_05940 [Proteus mirabilis]MBS3828482.1 CDP-glycerol glycerophosphotransferase family protein [Proteus mirabilis]MBS3839153.1 CDP-glycerol glycerophosphotransferase family protein [Proteus mirabilis]
MNKKFLISLLIFPICLLIKVFIKKKKYYFFSPLGLKGNIRYLYDFYLLKKEDCHSITTNHINKLNNLEYINLCFSLSSSKAIFLSHGIGGLPISCILTTRVQLWHGYPLKKILLKSQFDTRKYQSNLLNTIYLLLYKLRIKLSYSYLITSNSILGNELVESFNYKTNKILFYGSPSQEKAEQTKVKNNNGSYKILYLPTWRDGSDDIIKIVSSLIQSLDYHFMHENKFKLDIKLHPYDMIKIKEIDKNEYINFISHDVEDMIEFYSDYDCLITDYSSACFEYAPIGGKVIFFTPDLEKYTNQRGFTINYNELTQGKNTNNTNELKVAIMRAKNNNEYSLDYKKYVGVSDNCMELIYVKFNR